MIYESFSIEKEDVRKTDKTRGLTLIILSLATSIDALAAGLSLAALNILIWIPAAVIGVVAFLMTSLGGSMGPLVGRVVGRRAELAGGLVLIGIGIKILIDHL